MGSWAQADHKQPQALFYLLLSGCGHGCHWWLSSHRETCLMEPQTTCPASTTWQTPTPVCPERRSRRRKVACMRVTYVTRHSRRAVPCCDTNMSTQVCVAALRVNALLCVWCTQCMDWHKLRFSVRKVWSLFLSLTFIFFLAWWGTVELHDCVLVSTDFGVNLASCGCSGYRGSQCLTGRGLTLPHTKQALVLRKKRTLVDTSLAEEGIVTSNSLFLRCYQTLCHLIQ